MAMSHPAKEPSTAEQIIADVKAARKQAHDELRTTLLTPWQCRIENPKLDLLCALR